MTPQEAREKATANFKSGMNCTQSVTAVFAEGFGFSPEQIGALVQPFGGGKTQKDETYAMGQKLADEFRKINGSIVCRELLGLAAKQSDIPVSEARTEDYYKKRSCAELCGIAAEIFQKFLNEESVRGCNGGVSRCGTKWSNEADSGTMKDPTRHFKDSELLTKGRQKVAVPEKTVDTATTRRVVESTGMSGDTQ